MERQLPPFVLAERDALIAEVYEAFAGVTREGGVSWSEAYEIDCWKPPEEEQAKRQAAAREKDRDSSWTQLVDDSEWVSEVGLGGWSFLDAIGFRYYLPAQMVRCLEAKEGCVEESLAFALTLSDEQREHILQYWSLLDARQRRCVKRFLQYMELIEAGDWDLALESYWQGMPEGTSYMRSEDYVRNAADELKTLSHNLEDEIAHVIQTPENATAILTYARQRIDQSIQSIKKSLAQ